MRASELLYKVYKLLIILLSTNTKRIDFSELLDVQIERNILFIDYL